MRKPIYENVLADIEAINRIAVETALEKLRPALQESTKKALNNIKLHITATINIDTLCPSLLRSS